MKQKNNKNRTLLFHVLMSFHVFFFLLRRENVLPLEVLYQNKFMDTFSSKIFYTMAF